MKTIWKLSMGPGASGGEFRTLDDVRQWIDQGIVLVWGLTGPYGGSRLTQSEQFRLAHIGDYFYLCHGNEEPGVLLLGELQGHADPIHVPGGREGWYRREFRLIRSAVLDARYAGRRRGWAPNYQSTFVEIGEEDREEFQSLILEPYFGMTLSDLPLC